MITRKIRLRDDGELLNLFGQHDRNLNLIESHFKIDLAVRENILIIKGSQDGVKKAEGLIRELLERVRSGHAISYQNLESEIGLLGSKRVEREESYSGEKILVSDKGRIINPKTKMQREYVKLMRKHDIVFSIGPAGTGKTYLACAMALGSLREGKVSRIVLTRPVVEAGEKLGFLPGDLYEKVNPYLFPLFDAFYSMIGPHQFQKYRRDKIIEIIPLAYMRGRTLDDAFIILDEAQNSTLEQMKMFLTRLGFDAQAVITGDITQVDLENKGISGLIEVISILKGIKGIRFIYFTQRDVVRHPLVKKIVTAYERFEKRKNSHTKM